MQSLSKKEAEERLSEGVGKLEEIFNLEGKAVDELLSVTKVSLLIIQYWYEFYHDIRIVSDLIRIETLTLDCLLADFKGHASC